MIGLCVVLCRSVGSWSLVFVDPAQMGFCPPWRTSSGWVVGIRIWWTACSDSFACSGFLSIGIHFPFLMNLSNILLKRRPRSAWSCSWAHCLSATPASACTPRSWWWPYSIRQTVQECWVCGFRWCSARSNWCASRRSRFSLWPTSPFLHFLYSNRRSTYL